jgi:hypothetical protein
MDECVSQLLRHDLLHRRLRGRIRYHMIRYLVILISVRCMLIQTRMLDLLH